tara:strand:- start:661 stop:1314 length:654 start_codon:yes stop_codon:yes gene_type:complete
MRQNKLSNNIAHFGNKILKTCKIQRIHRKMRTKVFFRMTKNLISAKVIAKIQSENGCNIMLDDLSEVDKKILAALQEDCSLTNTELAQKVGLSTAPCWRRIKRLEDKGILTQRVALVNPKKLDLDILVYASVKLSSHTEESLEIFERTIGLYPEVTECYTISGSMDYMIRVITRDMQTYETFLRQKLLKMDMVNEIHSRFAVTKVKQTTAIPLELSI